MKIVNEDMLKIDGYMRVQDIDPGECFVFLNEERLYMRAGDYYFPVASADEVYDDIWDNETPVRPILTELKIKNC